MHQRHQQFHLVAKLGRINIVTNPPDPDLTANRGRISRHSYGITRYCRAHVVTRMAITTAAASVRCELLLCQIEHPTWGKCHPRATVSVRSEYLFECSGTGVSPVQFKNSRRRNGVNLDPVMLRTGFHSLSSSEEERVGERRPMVCKIKSPLPNPLPARASRGEGARPQQFQAAPRDLNLKNPHCRNGRCVKCFPPLP